MSTTHHVNRLNQETSPYLLQHAHNPVDWYPWGEEALSRARRENRPILLSVGYSACHWCHVMAHESFEDEATAKLMNELFVNIKVDREERPDLDRIYQAAHQLLTGRGGGWPLTMFLTPEQVPFFGGTYFPPEPRHGLPAFRDALRRVAAFYHEHGDQLAEQNQSLLHALTRTAATDDAPGRLRHANVDPAEEIPVVGGPADRQLDRLREVAGGRNIVGLPRIASGDPESRRDLAREVEAHGEVAERRQIEFDGVAHGGGARPGPGCRAGARGGGGPRAPRTPPPGSGRAQSPAEDRPEQRRRARQGCRPHARAGRAQGLL